MQIAPSATMQYRAKVIAAIAAKLPARVQVEKHDGQFDLESLNRIAGKTNAVYVAIVEAKPSSSIGNGQQYLNLTTTCFIVTGDDRGVDAADLGWAIGEVIASLAVQNAFTSPVMPAMGVHIQNLWSNDADRKRVSLTGVAWQNEIAIGADSAADALALIEGVVGAPEDGADMIEPTEHVGDSASSETYLASGP